MSLGFWFWLVYVVCYFFGGWWWWPQRTYLGIWSVGWLLLGILGWKVFGSPLSVLVH